MLVVRQRAPRSLRLYNSIVKQIRQSEIHMEQNQNDPGEELPASTISRSLTTPGTERDASQSDPRLMRFVERLPSRRFECPPHSCSRKHAFHRRLCGLDELDDRLIDGHVSPEIADLFFQAFGAEQVAHSRVRFDDSELDSAGRQLPMQRR
jgi:hypothetical protein